MKFTTKIEDVEAMLYTGKNGPDIAKYVEPLNAECEEQNEATVLAGKGPLVMLYKGQRITAVPGTYVLTTKDSITLLAQAAFEAKYEPI